MRRITVILAVGLILLGLPILGGEALVIDEVMVRYPAGYTKLLVMDVVPFLTDPQLMEGVIEPLLAANHPLVGIVRTIRLFEIPPETVEFIAHGQGPGLTSFSLIEGPPFAHTFGALQGLRAAAGAPGSPYTHWELESIQGLPVVFVGGIFGPIAIEWAYIPTEGALWIGTEVAFLPGRPDVARLRSTAELVAAKLAGKPGYFDELLIAAQVKGGQVAFVRVSAPGERPMEAGEQAMGFTFSLSSSGLSGRFALRFWTAADAVAAAERFAAGTSPYLALDLYRAELVELVHFGRSLDAGVTTTLSGLVGLLMLVMPF
jgi:hypothetical protein